MNDTLLPPRPSPQNIREAYVKKLGYTPLLFEVVDEQQPLQNKEVKIKEDEIYLKKSTFI